MEQNDAEVNQKMNVRSRNQGQEKSVTELRSKISLSNFQMLELTHNDCTFKRYLEKFTDRISKLNEKGINSIKLGNYQEATLYLGQAEKLLEYAASCGRAIDRQIILKILHNEAVIYQKTWDLQKSMNYIEAIIFNLKTYLNSKECTDIVQQLRHKNDQIKNSSFQSEEVEWFLESQFDKIKSILSKKYHLSLYYLQFSTLNSQNQDHQISLNNAQNALMNFREVFELGYLFLNVKQAIRIGIETQSIQLLEQLIIINRPKGDDYPFLLKQVKKIQSTFDRKSQVPSSFNHILQKYSSLQRKQAKYKNFSLASVMQLHPQSFGVQILDQSKLVQSDFYLEDFENTSILVERILQYAVVFFTISVEMKEINSESINCPINNPEYARILQEVHMLKQRQAQAYYIISLQISIEVVEELSQFSRYIFKHYFQIYSQEKIKTSTESLSKMDTLKEKYKKYLPDLNDPTRNPRLSDDDFCDNSISEYSINVKISTTGVSKDSKENKLEKLFKENSISASQHSNPAPPRLNIDLSEIQSLEYGGSKTFKQNNEISNHLQPQQVIQQEEYDNKQNKKLNNLNVKKIKTVPNLSDISSNKDSPSVSKQRSSGSKRSKTPQNQTNRSKQKPLVKQNHPKKNLKPISNTSKQKVEIKKFLSPKSINRKSLQPNQNKKSNQTQVKKKNNHEDKKIFSDRKVFTNNDRLENKANKEKKLLAIKEKKKKKQDLITPLPSNRNITQKEEPLKNQSRLRETKKLCQLRKAKSFEQVINPYADIKPIVYQSKDISDTYNIYQRPKLQQKLKFITEIKKTKSSENLKITVNHRKKKQQKKNSKLEIFHQNLSHNAEARQLLQTKDSAIKKNKKSSVSIKQPQVQSSTGWQHNAVRMSSVNNLANDKQGLRKMKSSKSLHESNYSSGYLLKGLNTNASQRTKAGSIAMTTSLRKKQ